MDGIAPAVPLAPLESGMKAVPGAPSSTRGYVRGSGLLLVGRFLSVFLNAGVQILAVRYLSKTDYGAFAYGIGVAALGSTVVQIGLSKAIPRLVPIYTERGDYGRTFGAIVLSALTIWTLGLLLVAGVWFGQSALAGRAHVGPEALSLLLILIALGPLDAFDSFLQQLVAVFCSPRAIFFRRQVFGPGLKLTAVLLAAVAGGDVHLLARCYVLASAVGVTMYMVSLARAWRAQGLLGHLKLRSIRLPVREVLGFSVPLLSTDLSVALRGSLVLIMLEYFRDAASVAELRAVISIAGLNTVVFDAFAFLFVPLASRMYARNDRGGIGDLYWLTSQWIAILTLPIFAVTCILSPVVTVLLFGHRYAEAAPLLAILAIGYYVNSALGFNASTLRVHGKIGLIVAGDTLTAVFGAVAGWILIREYGAMGAAISMTATFIVQNVFAHAGLWLGRTDIKLFGWPFVRLYLFIVSGTIALVVADRLLDPPGWLLAASAGAMCLVVVRLSRRSLDPRATFPELARIPLVRWLLA
jgi:O-antigen/teichoic acid export membrane protein